MTTQRRKYCQWFMGIFLALGPVPPMGNLKDIQTQKEYRTEVMKMWHATQNDLVSHKACFRFWKAYRRWYIDEIAPDRIRKQDTRGRAILIHEGEPLS